MKYTPILFGLAAVALGTFVSVSDQELFPGMLLAATGVGIVFMRVLRIENGEV